jgi:acyl transferase domain-containing protein
MACASSLTALHLAANGLRAGECDIAIAGAVNAIHYPKIFAIFSHAHVLAPALTRASQAAGLRVVTPSVHRAASQFVK